DPRRRLHPRSRQRQAKVRRIATCPPAGRRRPRRRRPAVVSLGSGEELGAMGKILLQTTIADTPDDWNVWRFSLLANELRGAGHEVTVRNRDGADDDSTLGMLDTLDYDQLWLMAVDPGDGLTPRDAAGIMRFRERRGGLLTARDHQDLGSCLLSL